ncbi:MAG: hypothetical protein ACKN89_05615 [Cyanobium sp.]
MVGELTARRHQACAGATSRPYPVLDAAAAYSAAIGREVCVEEIQPMLNELLAANVLMRLGHGL